MMMRLFYYRLKQDRFAQICFAILLLVLLAGIFAPLIAFHDPNVASPRIKYQMMSLTYPLGTDYLGRCVFSRLIYGIRTTIFYALLAMLLTITFGAVMGMIAGFYRGKVDSIIMRLCDMLLSYPEVVMILAIVGVLGPSIGNILVAIVLVKWAWYARMIRGAVLQYTHQNYIRYAQIIGAKNSYILYRHLLPMTAADMMILASTNIGTIILTISALSFLGLGIQPPVAEWGSMLSMAKQVMLSHPEQMLPAGIAITLVVIAFNGLGDFLRDVFDPMNRFDNTVPLGDHHE
ncbi:nickel transport system permease protein [Orbus hercynius]|uniref:Nickel transport system permease protein n=2 Tax=Orbus hercynius TaxID=593135 RepID=A0A495RIR2_9GAMM|nr:nickel/cobalt ABC transporter permease [Orbus hercynius]RKS87432.1 nickel transport system permease protein [Orbus hercynius]